MRLEIRKRVLGVSRKMLAYKALAVTLALLVDALIFIAMGVDPVQAYSHILEAAFFSTYGLAETVVKFIPLALVSYGLALAFKAQIWNIGAEGQLLIGAIAATWIGLNVEHLPPEALISLMYLGGFVAGTAWAFIPAMLRAKLRVNEVLTTFMMNLIAQKILEYLVYGPWRDPHGWGFPQTPPLPENARLPLIAGTRIHYTTLAIAAATCLFTYLLFSKTTIGYEIKVVGGNVRAANYAGINVAKIVLLVMIMSGGLAGIAGTGEIGGIHYRLRPTFSPGYGYTGIVIAWLGGLNPLGVTIAAFLYSGLLVGGDALQVAMGLPQATVNIFNGSILFFILAFEFLMRYEVRLKR